MPKTATKVGDIVEASVGPRSTIVLHPKVPLLIDKIDREALSPAVRRRIKRSLAEVQAGLISPAFETAEEGIAYLHRRAKRKR